MSKHVNEPVVVPTELRKQFLITQGAMYRSGILVSKEKVVKGLRAESLASGVVKQLGIAAFAAWRGRSTAAMATLPAAVPVILGGISKLWKQPKLKPVIRGVAIAGAVAGAFALYTRWARKSRAVDEDDVFSEEG